MPTFGVDMGNSHWIDRRAPVDWEHVKDVRLYP